MFHNGFDMFFCDDRHILVFDGLFLHFLVFGNLITEIGSFFKVFVTSSLSLEVFSLNQTFVDIFRINKIEGQIHLRTSFIEEVDGLVWQEAVLNVAVGQFCSCSNRFVCIFDVVVVLIFRLNTTQNSDGFLNRWFVNLNWLHTTLKGSIFFDDAVFVECCCSDQLKFPTSKGRF